MQQFLFFGFLVGAFFGFSAIFPLVGIVLALIVALHVFIYGKGFIEYLTHL